ncbi:DUF222 domain-containing protein, partial [Actinomyces viscosus]|uniref:DUF222 domain-containing protein n=2 Tax=Actinomyces viscosus TaxID=1656 RepID=UPI002852C371
QEQVLPQAPRRSVCQLGHDIERALIQADPDGHAERAQANAARRCVSRPRPAGEGVCRVSMLLPAMDALLLDATLDAIAASARAAGEERTLAQLRADAITSMTLATLRASQQTACQEAPNQSGSRAAEQQQSDWGRPDHPSACLRPQGALGGDAGDAGSGLEGSSLSGSSGASVSFPAVPTGFPAVRGSWAGCAAAGSHGSTGTRASAPVSHGSPAGGCANIHGGAYCSTHGSACGRGCGGGSGTPPDPNGPVSGAMGDSGAVAAGSAATGAIGSGRLLPDGVPLEGLLSALSSLVGSTSPWWRPSPTGRLPLPNNIRINVNVTVPLTSLVPPADPTSSGGDPGGGDGDSGPGGGGLATAPELTDRQPPQTTSSGRTLPTTGGRSLPTSGRGVPAAPTSSVPSQGPTCLVRAVEAEPAAGSVDRVPVAVPAGTAPHATAPTPTQAAPVTGAATTATTATETTKPTNTTGLTDPANATEVTDLAEPADPA